MTAEVDKEITGRYEVGQKLTIVSYRFDTKAYKDQFGIPREGRVLIDAIEIEICESKVVPGEWKPNIKHRGYRAKSKNGREFKCNWDHFDEAANNPYTWIEPNTTNYDLYYDAVLALQWNKVWPLVDGNGDAVEFDGISFCKIHLHYYGNGDKCYYCTLGWKV